MVGAAGKINKPKRQTKKSHQKKTHERSEETLKNTTEDKLRQCRTNPRANVKLSGKKKRLLKKAVGKALETPGTNMEVSRTPGSSRAEVGTMEIAQ
eukprot:Em0016g219a